MSSFLGSLKEYRNVSIDRFDKNNLLSTVYMLSHCHRDHMMGLEQPGLYRHLKSRDDVYLYCSEVTKLLLLSENAYRHLADFTRVLEVGVPTTVTIPDPDCDKQQYKSVLVTCLPAGHCPGSVMFLLEGSEGTALYTGDFRWEKNFATTLPALCVNGQMKPIDSMYVDTTFCVPEAFCIPSRDDCLHATAELVLSWLKRSPHHFVHISSRSKYGHEPLLAHLAHEAGTQVHISAERVSVYDQITELKGVYTADPCARIHACSSFVRGSAGGFALPCGYHPPVQDDCDAAKVKVMVIRPSTMWFTAEPSRLNELVVAPFSHRGIHRVCYSFHSSYSELRDLVSLLRPSRILPNVVPKDNTYEQVMARLQTFLTYKHQRHLSPAGDTTSAKPLGVLKRKRKDSLPAQSDSEGLVFDSPNKAASPVDCSTSKGPQPLSQGSTASDIISPVKSVASETHSSYQGSDHSDSDVDLFANDDSDVTPAKFIRLDEEVRSRSSQVSETRENMASGQSSSLLSYVSDDEGKEDDVGDGKDMDDAESVNPYNPVMITLSSTQLHGGQREHERETPCTAQGTFDTQLPTENNVSKNALSFKTVNPTEPWTSGRIQDCVERTADSAGAETKSGVTNRAGINLAADIPASDEKTDAADVIVIHSSQSSNEENMPGGVSCSAQGQRSKDSWKQGQNAGFQGQMLESSKGEKLASIDVQYQTAQNSAQKMKPSKSSVVCHQSEKTKKERSLVGTETQGPRSQGSQGHCDLTENNTILSTTSSTKSRETAHTVQVPCDVINVDDSCSSPNSHLPLASENCRFSHEVSQARQDSCTARKVNPVLNSEDNDEWKSHLTLLCAQRPPRNGEEGAVCISGLVSQPKVHMTDLTVGGATGNNIFNDSDSDATLPPDSPRHALESVGENMCSVADSVGDSCDLGIKQEKFNTLSSKYESQLKEEHKPSITQITQAVGDTSPLRETARRGNPPMITPPSTQWHGGLCEHKKVNSFSPRASSNHMREGHKAGKCLKSKCPHPAEKKLKKDVLSSATSGEEENTRTAHPTVIDLTQDDNS